MTLRRAAVPGEGVVHAKARDYGVAATQQNPLGIAEPHYWRLSAQSRHQT
jgi:hypothetical protein